MARKCILLTIVAIAGFCLLPIASHVRVQARPQRPSPITNPEYPTVALEGTSLLKLPISADLREEQRQQIIHYFMERIAATPAQRDRLWQPSFSSLDSYKASVREHRNHLRQMLGLIQPRLGTSQINILQDNAAMRVADVTIPVDSQLSARALLFWPRILAPAAGVIAIPPEDEGREAFAGIVQGMTPSKWLRVFLERGIAVAVPIMVERRDDHTICKQAGGKDRRRVLWRAGFIVGRTLLGIEVQQVLALREFFSSQPGVKQVAVLGEGQGGMTALYAGAVDEGLASVASVDYFQQREDCWKGPVDQVLYGQLNEFGDAEVAALIAPRPLRIVTTMDVAAVPQGAGPACADPSPAIAGSELALSRAKGQALKGGVTSASVQAEFARAQRFYGGLHLPDKLGLLEVQDDALQTIALKMASELGAAKVRTPLELTLQIPPQQVDEARNQHFEALFQYLQDLIAASRQVRSDYWQLNSTPPEDRPQKVQKLRKELADLVGVIPSDERVPLRPRTALLGETDKFLAYEVLLDVVPGVEVYGHLLVPRSAAGHAGRRLPAVICQHGFDGEPKYVSGVGDNLEPNDHYYHRFGQRLAERGYVVFAPYLSVPEDHHPPGIVHRADLVNPLVRLAACLGMMRTSMELAKLHRVVDFLQSLSFVDPSRIGYYGLSYGGYSAIWMPPLEPRLSLAVISAFYNDWQTMLTDASRYGSSYWSLPDEDFYNWNVLNRFVHTELIAAMWPRPVCIEYGSEDSVTTPVWHQRAWKELKTFIDAWGMDDKIVDDDFLGPHTIHGIGTFFFLDRWLRPESPARRDYGCRDYNYCDQNVAPGFYGYSPVSPETVPYATQVLDSSPASVIRGRFYVADISSVFIGLACKIARNGNPGDLVVRFGSREGSADIGEARILAREVAPQADLWYEARVQSPVRLDPQKLYFFELTVEPGQDAKASYTVFGPKPLGGMDDASHFGLSFRTLTKEVE